MTSLSLDNVSRSFGGVQAAAGVTFDVPAGSIVGLIGPNGAGKTTVVNLITGVLRLDAGKVTVGDTDVTTASTVDVSRAGVCRTFQQGRVLSESSVLDNVMVGFVQGATTSPVARLFGLPSARRECREAEEKARALLDSVGLGAYAEAPATSLAYGHRRRIEILRAMATQPRFLLLDEPVAGMNDVEAGELADLFRTLAGRGIGILLIEHNMRFVNAICSIMHVLNTGRIIASGTPAEIGRNPDVITAYLGS